MRTLTFLIAVFSFQTVFAQWEKIPMPKGGDIHSLYLTGDRVWTKCSNRNYYSDDKGQSWKLWALQDSLEAIELTADGQTLMAVGKKRMIDLESEETIFRSPDGGNTWNAVYSDTLGQYTLVNAFSAGPYLFFEDLDYALGWHLYRSDDNGKTWKNISVFGNGTGGKRLGLVQKNGNDLIAVIDLLDNMGYPHDYRVISADYGQTWTKISLPYFSGSNWLQIMDQCWIAADSAGTASSLYISFDSGHTFKEYPKPICAKQWFFSSSGSLFSYSQDCIVTLNTGTASWDPVQTPPISVEHFVKMGNGTMLAGTWARGAWVKADDNTPWTEANNGLESTDAYDFLAGEDQLSLLNETGFNVSLDKGATWVNRKLPDTLFPFNSCHLYQWGDSLLAGIGNRLFFSTNGGQEWHFLSQLNDIYDTYTDLVYFRGDTLVAAIRGLTQFYVTYTPDRGQNWLPIPLPALPTGAGIEGLYSYGGNIWISIGYPDGKIYVSDNAGQSWWLSYAPNYYGKLLGEREHLMMIGDPVVFGAEHKNLYSPDGGETWLLSEGIPPDQRLSSNAKTGKKGHWYGVVPNIGIYTTEDYGAHWALFDPAVYPNAQEVFLAEKTLYTLRFPSGLWRMPLVETGTEQPETALSSIVITPNPAGNTVLLQLPEALPAGQKIRLYDLSGRMVLETALNPGSTVCRLGIAPLAAGTYVVKAGKWSGKLLKQVSSN